MNIEAFEQLFETMGFFECTEDEETFVYCFEPQEGGEYLLVSDEFGHTPKAGANLIIACYSPADAFLWKVEIKDVHKLQEIYQSSVDGTAFIHKLAQLAG